MAYLKVEKKKSGTYLTIIESYREGDKVKKRVLYNLGRAEKYSKTTLQRIGKRLYELGGGHLPDLIGIVHEPEELSRQNYGYFQVYSKILQSYRLPQLFEKIIKIHELGYELTNVILLMLLGRLSAPDSKHGTWRFQSDFLGLLPSELHHLYRSLDKLSQYSEQIQELIYSQGRDLFNSSLDLVYYDVTTFYFDSEVEQEGSLRQKGFGKDGKIGKTQILFGMLIDKDKRPIGYQIYQGDSYEGHTFKDSIDHLREKYHISKVIIVADRGMMSKENLEYLGPPAEKPETPQYNFIIGERLKNLPREAQKQLLDKEKYTQEWIIEDDEGSIPILYTTLTWKNKTIIGTFSAKRAKKDQLAREEKLRKAEEMLKAPSKLKNKASRYYLKNTTGEQYEIDTKKIENAKKFDGFLAISTNTKELSIPVVLEQYKNLFQIEHSFRTFKSYLEARPIFHWNDERIRGHICLCYIAYTLQNHLQLQLKSDNTLFSENKIRKLLDKMQVSLIRQGDEQFYLRASLDKEQEELIKLLKLKKLPNLFPKDDLDKYINIVKK